MLERNGLSEQTLVVFTSDNGPWLSKGSQGGSAWPLRAGKSTPYEGGHRVPAIFRQPGPVAQDVTCNVIATMMGLLPTCVRMAGGDLPAGLDGHDLMPLLRSEVSNVSPYEALFIEGTVRQQGWKLILHPDGNVELFNLDEDIAEKMNLS